ncbi:hypothetical protein CQA53_05975 [Helicobacter didelphidarum]|uniref:Lipopolysaccharide heptosyltransferase family protein n=1 Tax=Helicobacter didelphidarum TaxID=2040648 RepID=A0A3D8ILC5_9HELI|nr:glycosyltransferase family 9 protein [Helicobacter didelphidarum]RDU65706.1 hypothetical protein CQA53_05975 [Helicobacter didelphidarum]
MRKINPKLYDSKINTIDLTKSRVKTGKENKRIISDFFQHYIKVLEQKSENINLSKSYLIMVNPFSHSAQRSFRALEWLMLIKKISNLPQCLVLVVTYGSGYDNFMCNLKEAKMDSIPNLLIFQNNHDILNLVEIISRVSCLISPSSGPIHIASNLCIPTIGIYSEHDTKKWATWDRRYVVLKKIQPSIEETEEAIQKTIDLLQECITTKTILPKDIHALCEI